MSFSLPLGLLDPLTLSALKVPTGSGSPAFPPTGSGDQFDGRFLLKLAMHFPSLSGNSRRTRLDAADA